MTNASLADDPQATLRCLRGLGAELTVLDGAAGAGEVVCGGWEPRAPEGVLDCGNSGTTLRLLAAQAARFDFETHLTGDASLRSRSSAPLFDALRSLGAEVRDRDGCVPAVVRGPIRSGEVRLAPAVSSQFASALVLAFAAHEGGVLRLDKPIHSRPYLELTLAMGAGLGLQWTLEESPGELSINVPAQPRPRASSIAVEGDWSGAAFLLVASAIRKPHFGVQGLDRDSLQGDRAIVAHLRAFGASCEGEGNWIGVRADALGAPGEIDVTQTPDLFPPLAVLAACAQGETILHGNGGLRNKECDRIRAMADGLNALGIRAEERGNSLVIEGDTPRGGRVHTHADHRIYMAFAVLSLVAQGEVELDHPECVAVSFPQFHEHLAAMRAL